MMVSLALKSCIVRIDILKLTEVGTRPHYIQLQIPTSTLPYPRSLASQTPTPQSLHGSNHIPDTYGRTSVPFSQSVMLTLSPPIRPLR